MAGFLIQLSAQSWRRPTFPVKRVSSALQGLTSLFGMGRGVTPATSHQDSALNFFCVIH